MRTVQFTARSEEDAVRKAADNLSIRPDEVNYKIVSRTSGGLLGMLGQQVVTIEVTLQDKTRKEEVAAPPPLPRKDRWSDDDDMPDEVPTFVADEEAEPEAEAGSEDAQPRKREGSPEKKKRQRSRKRREERKPRRDDDEEVATSVEEIDEAVFAEKLEKAGKFVTDIVEIVGGKAEVKAFQKEAEIFVSVIGELPDWLGRGNSRTVDALQFVANKVINRFPPRYRVVIATEGQREERLQNLEQAALELGRKVIETGEPAWLVPMNPKERRIVHLSVATLSGLGTRSVGDGPSRRLCIYKLEEKAE